MINAIAVIIIKKSEQKTIGVPISSKFRLNDKKYKEINV